MNHLTAKNFTNRLSTGRRAKQFAVRWLDPVQPGPATGPFPKTSDGQSECLRGPDKTASDRSEFSTSTSLVGSFGTGAVLSGSAGANLRSADRVLHGCGARDGGGTRYPLSTEREFHGNVAKVAGTEQPRRVIQSPPPRFSQALPSHDVMQYLAASNTPSVACPDRTRGRQA
jgi:hypothetical protein